MTSLRLAILGDEKVGKSAVTVRFLTKRFIGEYNSNRDLLYRSSIKQDDSQTDLELLDSCSKKDAKSSISDTPGWADGYIIIYSICDQTSFQAAKILLDTLNKSRASLFTPILLLGNMVDLEHRRTVGVEDGHKLALENGCLYYEVSAADSYISIAIAFKALIREAKAMQNQRPTINKRRRNSLVSMSKRLGAMFSKNKDSPESERRRSSTSCEIQVIEQRQL
ncbi:hypothetical protein LOTGIDRAFT_151492 [Lottia gigantea]|uniref:small monomeric GTPase n=1 Tax=Lottia gigantea TaxID=225164 RepID=V4AAP0_LOTGI|nr:hypothetical protein LOTGIDRAFT_151492 [Lottia gigantea]ESP01069.1 hypothetical protein LOTGIDRAFT_151492 [Lottia gigantea]